MLTPFLVLWQIQLSRSDTSLLENCSVVIIRHELHHTEDVIIDADTTTEHEIDVLITRVPHRELSYRTTTLRDL